VRLFAIKLNYQLLIHRQLNIFTLGQCQDAPFVIVAIDFEPRRRISVSGKFLCLLENRQLTAGLANHDLIANTDLERWDVHLAAIHIDVAVTNQLTRLATGDAESDAKNNGIETALELLQQQLAGHALGA